MPLPAIWAGLECTLNRVGDQFYNQVVKSGHLDRLTDLKKFAELNVERVRYPCLWENICPHDSKKFDWHWTDQRLHEMKVLGLKPILGLLHHGSGPCYTSLVDPQFPELFARFAGAVAERYDWIEDYTPINEILTTALFSCLYGHWYPHRRNDQDFVKAVFNQVKASVLAMREIRKVQPRARFIQTEDLGKAQSTTLLSYQADFQNQRRWLSFDMLCGKMEKTHALADYLRRSGFQENDFDWLKENFLAPDVLGVNHYLLSNRFLDHQIEKYPQWARGGNGIHRYADVGAIDTPSIQVPTPSSIVSDVWDRYKLPIAVTEVHICGYREDQLRWLSQIWTECRDLIDQGVNIGAVTAWSLLGSYDWNYLCTRDEKFYEPGVFDLRSPRQEPKETIVSQWIKSISDGKNFDHPVLDLPGWWKRKEKNSMSSSRERRLLITGGRGTLARAFARVCECRNIPFQIVDRSMLDIARNDQVVEVLDKIRPWAVVNAAGYVNVDQAEQDPVRCFRENVEGVKNLALWCAEHRVPLFTFSSDLVFDGEQDTPYRESDLVSPLNTYGQSKVECEKKVLEIYPEATIIRTSAFFGPWDQVNFVTQILKQTALRRKVLAANDLVMSPTYVPDLANTCLDLLIDGERGLIHLANQGNISWADFAYLVADQGHRYMPGIIHRDDIISTSHRDLGYQARRPKNSALTSDRLRILPEVENALFRYFQQLEMPFLKEYKESFL